MVGVPQLANSQVRGPFSLLALTKPENSKAESGDAKAPLLESSLILSAAEQCCTGEHNHFMAQI